MCNLQIFAGPRVNEDGINYGIKVFNFHAKVLLKLFHQEKYPINPTNSSARINRISINFTLAGRLCLYDARKGVKAENFPNFTSFSKFLVLKCADGKTGFFKWTPTRYLIGKKLYYQVHLY